MIKEIRNITINNQDMYFFKKTQDYIIINYLYKGISVYDNDLNFIKTIMIIDDLLIHDAYVAFNGSCILLYCPENQTFIWINIETSDFSIIKLHEFAETIFSRIYWWLDDNEIIVTDYKENCYIIDINTRTIGLIKKDYIQKYPKFFALWQECKLLPITHFFPDFDIICWEDIDSYIFYNYRTYEKKIISTFRASTHDINYFQGYIVFIHEKQLDILFPNNYRITIDAEYSWIFLRAFLFNDDYMKLVVLQSSKSDPSRNALVTYTDI